MSLTTSGNGSYRTDTYRLASTSLLREVVAQLKLTLKNKDLFPNWMTTENERERQSCTLHCSASSEWSADRSGGGPTVFSVGRRRNGYQEASYRLQRSTRQNLWSCLERNERPATKNKLALSPSFSFWRQVTWLHWHYLWLKINTGNVLYHLWLNRLLRS